MQPAFKPGDRVLVAWWWPRRLLWRGAVVIVEHPVMDNLLMKRVVGLPESNVTTRITDLPLDLQVQLREQHSADGFREWRVPSNSYFLRGDAGHSIDSSTLGPIHEDRLRGLVIARLAHATKSRG